MNCQRCNSQRVIVAQSKGSDLHSFCSYESKKEAEGYNRFKDSGVYDKDLGEDYLSVEFCLECGQLQGEFPRPVLPLELEEFESECDSEELEEYEPHPHQ